MAHVLKSKPATQAAILVITCVAFLLRVNRLGAQSLWRDEVDTIRFSRWAIQEYWLLGLTKVGHNGPLYFALIYPWRQVTGISEFALRYPSALAGALIVPLGYVLARQLGFSRHTGVITGLLLVTSPYLVWYGQEAKMYTLLVAVVTLAFIGYLKALTGTQVRWWVLFVCATSASFYLHILSPLMLLVYGFVALIFFADLRRRWKPWLISMTCLTLPYLPLVIWQFSFFWEGINTGHPFYGFRQQFYLLLQLYSNGLLRLAGITTLILFVFLFLCGLFISNGRTVFEHLKPANRLVLAAWVLLPPLIAYGISLRVPVFEDRYLIYITPPFYLTAALGVILIRHYSRWLAALCLGLALTFNLISVWQQQYRPIKADFRAAAQFLMNQPNPPVTIMVQMPYVRHTLNYYYQPKYELLEGLWTNNGKTEAEVNAEMTQLTANLTELWLVVSEGEQWDNRKMVQGWLEQHAGLVNQAHFTRVDIYHYKLRPGTINNQSIVNQ